MKALFANNTVIIICYSLISIAGINTITKSNSGGKRSYFILHAQVMTPHGGVKAGTQTESTEKQCLWLTLWFLVS